jgi:hypothetical protein
MIPLFVVIGFRTWRNRILRLWFPLFLAWLLLLPVILLLLPVFLVACLVGRVSPLRALSTGWQVLTGLKGTHIEVDDSKTLILIRIV